MILFELISTACEGIDFHHPSGAWRVPVDSKDLMFLSHLSNVEFILYRINRGEEVVTILLLFLVLMPQQVENKVRDINYVGNIQ